MLIRGKVLTSKANGVLAKSASRVVRVIFACSLVLTFALCGCTPQENNVPKLKEPQIKSPAIAVDGKLRVGVNSNNSPLAGKSGDRIIGMDVDIAAAVADELGLELSIVDVGTEGAKAIEDEKVDVVFGVESGTSELGYWLSSQYLQSGVVLFKDASTKVSTPTATSAPKIAAQVSSKSAWAVTNIFGDESLAAATDLTAAFSSLMKHEVDFVASDAIIGLYAANKQKYDVEICALLESPTGYCAMTSDENRELREAIQNALSTIIDNGIIDIIEDKWLGRVVSLTGVSKIEGVKSQSTNTENALGDNEVAIEGASSAGAASSSSSAATSADANKPQASSSSSATAAAGAR